PAAGATDRGRGGEVAGRRGRTHRRAARRRSAAPRSGSGPGPGPAGGPAGLYRVPPLAPPRGAAERVRAALPLGHGPRRPAPRPAADARLHPAHVPRLLRTPGRPALWG